MVALTEIGKRAFEGTPLTQLGNLSSLTTIGDGAFYYTKLEKLGKMSRLTQIGPGAFYKTLLTQLGNMDSLTTIGGWAFQDCEHLNSVHLPNTLKNVGKDAFDGCPLGQLSVEPGAEFVCECTSLASKLQALDNVHVDYLTSGVQISTV